MNRFRHTIIAAILSMALVAPPVQATGSETSRRENTERGERRSAPNRPGGNGARPAASGSRPGGNSHNNSQSRPERPGNNGNHNNGNTRPGNNGWNNNGNHNNGNTRPERPGNNGNHNNGNNRPDRPGNNGNHNNGNNRPDRPGNNGNHNNGNHNRPGNNWSNGNHNRPGNNGNHGNYRPSRPSRPGGFTPPPPPPSRPHRPTRPGWSGWYRPTPPRSWRPVRGAIRVNTILGMTFGTALATSINYLTGAGYSIDGYQDGVVYLRNVPQLNLFWPDAMLYYNDGCLYGSEYSFSSPYMDRGHYLSAYNSLVLNYGQPVTVQQPSPGAIRATWFLPGNQFISLSFGPQYSRYYTTLEVGVY